MLRFFWRNAGLISLLLVNLAVTLIVQPCLIALNEPTVGLEWLILFIGVTAIVPAQACLIVGWAAMGHRLWLVRVAQATFCGLLMLVLLRSASLSSAPDMEDHLVLMTSAAISVYAILRPLAVILGWEFGDRPPSQARGQFRVLDIMEWIAAFALATVTAQLFPGAVMWVGLCLVCCLAVLTLSSAFKRRRLAIGVIVVGMTVLAGAIHAVVVYFKAYNAAMGLPSMSGMLAAAAIVTGGNLFALDLLGYRLHRRPKSLATSTASLAPSLVAHPPGPAGT
jgi:hypothetical protein